MLLERGTAARPALFITVSAVMVVISEEEGDVVLMSQPREPEERGSTDWTVVWQARSPPADWNEDSR